MNFKTKEDAISYVKETFTELADYHSKEFGIAILAAYKKLTEVIGIPADEAMQMVADWQKPIIRAHEVILKQCIDDAKAKLP